MSVDIDDFVAKYVPVNENSPAREWSGIKAEAKIELEQLISRVVVGGKYQVLQDLLDWHNLWFNTHNKEDLFNWYRAIKAMQVMKDPQKPFHELATLQGDK